MSMSSQAVLKYLPTEQGNILLKRMTAAGWKIKSQYSPLAFDKGIDYDRYTLVRGTEMVQLEWDNWFEWSLTGSETLLTELMPRFGLSGTLQRPDAL